MVRGRLGLTMKVILMFSVSIMLAEAKTDPGVIGRLTLKGLQYGWQVGLQVLQRQKSSIHIPDVEGSVSVAVLGRIEYQVSGLQIRSFDLSQSRLAYSPNTGVNVSIQQGEIEIAGDIWIKMGLLSASARMTLWVRGLSVAGSLGITCDDLGHAAVWDAGCLSNVGQVDLSFSGGSGWIFSMFKGSMIGPVRSAISDKICPSFQEAVIQVEKKLSSLPVTLRVDPVSDLEVDLVGPPFITGELCDFFVKAEFVAHSQYVSPYHPERMLLPDVDSRMVLLALSQFSANSAWWAHYKAGFLKYNITDDMIPKLSPLRLDVRSLGVFAPELPARFPDSPPLLLQVSARSAPTVTCKPDSLTVQASAGIELFALYPNQPPIALFQMQVDSLTGVNLVLSEESVGATISVQNFSLSLVHSDVGTVKVDTMQKTLNAALKLLLPFLNGHLRNIYPLAPIGLGLQNATFRVMKGYMVIMTDLQVIGSSPPHGRIVERSKPPHGERFQL